jgi:maltooligosyltrehalose trehalohydrolase
MKAEHTRLQEFAVRQLRIWAPTKSEVIMEVVFPEKKTIALEKTDDGYFVLPDNDLPEGTRYFLKCDDGIRRPNPYSHYQPEGVHGPSEIINHATFTWHDESWKGTPFHELIFYELHVGTFTPEGTFEAIIPRLPEFVDVGINALELMPVAQFPGARNWGYDGVYPFAVQNSYGGPVGLKKLVDACHQFGISVFLDVVYNHVGPEGNYLKDFAPFFTGRYEVPWGDAINFDGEWSDGVRDYYRDNVRHWITNYHMDGLRLDAIHMMYDSSAVHILQALSNEVKILESELDRQIALVAESDFNDPRVVTPVQNNGLGLSAQWLDDFHHAWYAVLDEKGKDRYEDFGSLQQVVKAYRDGFVLDGGFVKFRKRHYGRSSSHVRASCFVAFNQNHDQIGNRPKGERLSKLIDFERLKLAMAALVLSPYVPLLFMGEEYGEDSPFYYFVSHSEEALIKAVSEGRRKEFSAFGDVDSLPEAQDELTFLQSKLGWSKRTTGPYAAMLRWTKDLIRIRRSTPGLSHCDKNQLEVTALENKCLVLIWRDDENERSFICLLNLSDECVTYVVRSTMNNIVRLLDSRDYGEAEHTSCHESVGSRITIPGGVAAIYTAHEKFSRNPQAQ